MIPISSPRYPCMRVTEGDTTVLGLFVSGKVSRVFAQGEGKEAFLTGLGFRV